MLENSITDGYLYNFRDPVDGSGDLDKMSEVVDAFKGQSESVPCRMARYLDAVDWSMGAIYDGTCT